MLQVRWKKITNLDYKKRHHFFIFRMLVQLLLWLPKIWKMHWNLQSSSFLLVYNKWILNTEYIWKLTKHLPICTFSQCMVRVGGLITAFALQLSKQKQSKGKEWKWTAALCWVFSYLHHTSNYHDKIPPSNLIVTHMYHPGPCSTHMTVSPETCTNCVKF